MCLYCGASPGQQPSSKINVVVNQERHITVSDDQHKELKPEDLPENVRQKVEAAIREGRGDVMVNDARTVVQPSLERTSAEECALSFEKVLSLLSKLKESLDCGKLEHGVYERIAAGFIKDYIAALPVETRLNFVVNEIPDSALSDYIDDKMLTDLRAFVLSSIPADK